MGCCTYPPCPHNCAPCAPHESKKQSIVQKKITSPEQPQNASKIPPQICRQMPSNPFGKPPQPFGTLWKASLPLVGLKRAFQGPSKAIPVFGVFLAFRILLSLFLGVPALGALLKKKKSSTARPEHCGGSVRVTLRKNFGKRRSYHHREVEWSPRQGVVPRPSGEIGQFLIP